MITIPSFRNWRLQLTHYLLLIATVLYFIQPGTSKPVTENSKLQTLPSPIVYSTFIGGSGYDDGRSIAIDSSGCAYITGGTESADFPSTIGSFDTSSNGDRDVFVAKLDSTGAHLIYSTFIGGSDLDEGNGLAVDPAGNAYVTGYTQSTNFPTTAGTFNHGITPSASNINPFVLKLNSYGTNLVYSIYLSTNGSNGQGCAIAVDSEGNAYVTGWTNATDFPTTPGAFQTLLKGSDAFITKINPDGTTLVYSTLLGGAMADDFGKAIAIDNTGCAYITGYTESGNFPITPDAFIRFTNNLYYNAFVTKLNPDGSALVYSTYLNGSTGDSLGLAIAVDFKGNAYVTGQTCATDFSITSSAFQMMNKGGYDGFLAKLNPAGSKLDYATYLGGNENDYGYSIAVDSGGIAFITGYTVSGNFPTTHGAFDSTLGNGGVFDFDGDGYLVIINPNQSSSLLYSTYIGGTHLDVGLGIKVDGKGNAYLTGQASAGDFPVTAGAYDTCYHGNGDAFVMKFNYGNLIFPTADFYATPTTGYNPLKVQFYDASGAGTPTSWHWDYGDGATDTTQNPIHIYHSYGLYTVQLIVSNSAGISTCLKEKYIQIQKGPFVYSTFIGGSGYDEGRSIAVDSEGNAYIAVGTESFDFPTTAGSLDTAFNGGMDILKLNSTGSQLIYSTFICGSGVVEGYGLAIDSAGNAYVIGHTDSVDFPTTPGAFQTVLNGGGAFISKINSTGTALIYSTLLGGSGDAYGQAIAIDSAGNAYVTGYTQSTDFPTTPGAFQRVLKGYDDVFITKINPAGSALIYSTLLGGDIEDYGKAIAIDSAGDAYVTGITHSSTDFPIVTTGYNSGPGGGEGFISKLSPDGSRLIYSVWVGGYGNSIAVDLNGNAYITGYTNDDRNVATEWGIQTKSSCYTGDGLLKWTGFFERENPSGSQFDYGTYFGGSGNAYGNSIDIDRAGNVYITGYAQSTDFQITPGAYDTTYDSHEKAFLMIINPNMRNALLYSTYIGGDGNDVGKGIKLDGNGNVYITGYTESSDFPITAGAYDTTNHGNGDAFVMKFNYGNLIAPVADFYATPTSGYKPLTVHFYDASGAGTPTTWQWNFGDGSIDTTPNPVHTYPDLGVYSVQLIVGNSFGASTVLKSSYVQVTGQPPVADFYGTPTTGNNSLTVNFYDTSTGGSPNNWYWDFGDGSSIWARNPTHTYSSSGWYTVTFWSSNAYGVSSVVKTNYIHINVYFPLVYSTFLGGSGYDSGRSIGVDSAGCVYVTGWTESPDFPTTIGSFDTTLSGKRNAFITKLDSTGSNVIYSTLIGGSNIDEGESIAIDPAGNAYISGFTQSTDFPTTPGAFSPGSLPTTTIGNLFVVKLNSSGARLDYSFYLTVDGSALGSSAIAVNSIGNVYITGGIIRGNPWWKGLDVFAIQINSLGTSLIYSTSFGGNNKVFPDSGNPDDYGTSIAIDSAGNAYITGLTTTPDFPVTAGAYDTVPWGNNRYYDVGFVTKLNSSGTIVYSTFLGGNATYCNSIAVDKNGCAYVMGDTRSGLTTTPNAVQKVFNHDLEGFCVKLNPAGSDLNYATYIGGNRDDYGYGIAIDSAENIFVTGYTLSTATSFPITTGSWDTTGAAYLMVIDPNKNPSLVYSTYLGGTSIDAAVSIKVDGKGNVYLAGETYSADFPTTPWAYDTSYHGNGDAFVMKFNYGNLISPVADFYGIPTSGYFPLTVKFYDASTGGAPDTWYWDFGDGTDYWGGNPSHTYSSVGKYTVKLWSSNSFGVSSVVKLSYIQVTGQPPIADFYGTPTSGYKPLTVQFNDASGAGTPTSWQWTFGDGGTDTTQNPSHIYTNVGLYSVRLISSNAFGSSTILKTSYIQVIGQPPVADFYGTPTTGYNPLAVQFYDATTGGTADTWYWDFGDGTTVWTRNPSHSYATPGYYTVKFWSSNSYGISSAIKTNYIHVDGRPPVAIFYAIPTSGYESLTVRFYDQSMNQPNGWLWDFGDGAGDTTQNPTHIFSTPGSYTIRLIAINPYAVNTIIMTNFIQVSGRPPQVDFYATPTSGYAPLSVQFTDQSLFSPNSWQWDFGDGTGSIQSSPLHSYRTTGNFAVRLIASNTYGLNSIIKTNLIHVTGHSPVADFTASPLEGYAPLSVQFNDQSSYLPTGWKWVYGDGATDTAQNPSHIYPTPGYYSVSLIVTNPWGTSTVTKTRYIHVDGLAPMAFFSGIPTVGFSPLTVQFYDNSTGGTPDTWYWEFGDGSTIWTRNPVHIYDTPGLYTVKFWASNPYGVSSVIKAGYIQATERSPITDFYATPTSGNTPLTVYFYDQTLYRPTNWQWDFGDGTGDTTRNPNHTYPRTGIYTIRLIASNSLGFNTAIKNDYLYILGATPFAVFYATPTSGYSPLTVQFYNNSLGGEPYYWLWNFGDGYFNQSPSNVTHVYQNYGSYTVSLEIRNSSGICTTIKPDYIHVLEPKTDINDWYLLSNLYDLKVPIGNMTGDKVSLLPSRSRFSYR